MGSGVADAFVAGPSSAPGDEARLVALPTADAEGEAAAGGIGRTEFGGGVFETRSASSLREPPLRKERGACDGRSGSSDIFLSPEVMLGAAEGTLGMLGWAPDGSPGSAAKSGAAKRRSISAASSAFADFALSTIAAAR